MRHKHITSRDGPRVALRARRVELWKPVGIGIGSVLFGAAVGWVAFTEPQPPGLHIYAIAAFFFLIGVWIIKHFARVLFTSEPILLIDERGIYDERTTFDWIDWSDIEYARVWSEASHPKLAIYLTNIYKYTRRSGFGTRLAYGISAALGHKGLSLGMGIFDPEEISVVQQVVDYYATQLTR